MDLRKRKSSLVKFITISLVAGTLSMHAAVFGAVGRTAAAFDVSATGEAEYSIPLFAPSGAGGLTPRLSMTYRSRSGNGVMGMGWRLDGFSVITRCPQTYAQDPHSRGVELHAADRFCLDGMRLRRRAGTTYGASGTLYGTEIDSFSRIEIPATGGLGAPPPTGPHWFRVYRKDGLIHEYGKTVDSRIESSGTSIPRVWALSRVLDTAGNYIDFEYMKDTANGSYRPLRVRYTGNSGAAVTPPYTIEFEYESRPGAETPTGYFAGSRVREINRLIRISLNYQSSLIRRYVLAYDGTSVATGRSRLQSVQECSVSDCFPATVFGWQSGAAGWSSAIGSDASTNANNAVILDLNGDGRSDVLFAQPPSVSSTCFSLATTAGFAPKICNALTYYATQSNASRWTRSAFTRVLDIDGDGRQEFLQFNTQINQWELLRLNSANSALNRVALGFADGSSGSSRATVADVDGDGRDDFIFSIADPIQRANNGIYMRRSTGTGFESPTKIFLGLRQNAAGLDYVVHVTEGFINAGDVNGDGRDDILAQTWNQDVSFDYETWSLFTTFQGTDSTIYQSINGALLAFATPLATQQPFKYTPIVADFNGDGLSDIASVGSAWEVRFGTGGRASPLSPVVGVALPTINGDIVTAADYDNDGRTDLIYTQAGSVMVARSNGIAFEAPVSTGTSVSSARVIATTDSTGDGTADLVTISATAGTSSIDTLGHNGLPADLLRTATDAFGNSVTVNYASISQDRYSDSEEGTFPALPYRRPIYVVGSYSASDAVGGAYSINYWYYGSAYDRLGRGFLGFRERRYSDSRTGFSTQERFDLEFPTIGRLNRREIYQSDAVTLVSRYASDYTYGLQVPELPGEHIAYNYSPSDRMCEYEVGGTRNGQFIRCVEHSIAALGMDELSGLPLNSSIQVSDDNYTHTTTTVHSNLVSDTNTACVGRPRSTTITSGHSGYSGSTVIRRFSAAWDEARCRPLRLILEPGDANLELSTEYEYDAFGNIATETISGAGIPNRVSQANFGIAGRFVELSTDAEGNVTDPQWDYALGVRTGETAPSGAFSAFDYDSFGRLLKVTHPDTTRTIHSYEWCNSQNNYCNRGSQAKFRIKTTTRRQDETTLIAEHSSILDAAERVLRQATRLPDAQYSFVDTNYSARGKVATQTAPYFEGDASYTTSFTYDLLNRVTRVERPENDAVSAPMVSTLYFYETSQTRIVDEEAKEQAISRKPDGKIASVTDAYGTALGVTASYDYNALGNLTRVLLPDTTEMRYSYNVRGFKTQTIHPDSGTWTYEYWPTGELRRVRDAKTASGGWTTTYEYDRLGRIRVRADNPENATTTWEYDPNTASCAEGAVGGRGRGQVAAKYYTVNGTVQYRQNYCYDSIGRLAAKGIAVAGEAGSFNYAWSYNSATGLLDTLSYPALPDGRRLRVKHEYDAGMLRRLRNADPLYSQLFWEGITFNARGQVLSSYSEEGPFGACLFCYDEVNVYDAVTGSLEDTVGVYYGYFDQEGYPAPDTAKDIHYQWSATGNLKLTNYFGPQSANVYQYDDLGRLDTVRNGAGELMLDVSYNAAGGIEGWAGQKTSGAFVDFAYSDLNHPHAVTAVGSVAHSYDANGNLQQRGGQPITWYSYNLPRRINGAGGSYSEFQYGPDREYYKQTYVDAARPSENDTVLYLDGLFQRRVLNGVTTYTHHVMLGDTMVAMVQSQCVGASGCMFPQKWVAHDALGSLVAECGAGWSFCYSNFYDAFGRRIRSWQDEANPISQWEFGEFKYQGRFGFTSHEHLDNVGMIHMGGRLYLPEIGRFLSPDPVAPSMSHSQSLNPYSYARNNPSSFVDPTGLTEEHLFRYEHVLVQAQRWQLPISVSTASGTREFRLADFVDTAAVLPRGSVGDLARGALASLGNSAINMSPIMLLFSDEWGSDFIDVPDTQFGQIGENLEDVVEFAGSAMLIPLKAGARAENAIGFAAGTGTTAFTARRLQHASRHLISAKLLPNWSKATGELFTKIGSAIIENPLATFDDVLRDGNRVKGFIGMINGQPVAFQVYKTGPYAGEIATSFVPSPAQLRNWGFAFP